MMTRGVLLGGESVTSADIDYRNRQSQYTYSAVGEEKRTGNSARRASISALTAFNSASTAISLSWINLSFSSDSSSDLLWRSSSFLNLSSHSPLGIPASAPASITVGVALTVLEGGRVNAGLVVGSLEVDVDADADDEVPGRLATSPTLPLPLDCMSMLFSLLPLTFGPPALIGDSTLVMMTAAKCETSWSINASDFWLAPFNP